MRQTTIRAIRTAIALLAVLGALVAGMAACLPERGGPAAEPAAVFEQQSATTFLRQTAVAVTTVGAAGAATGSGSSSYICGHLHAMYLDFTASISATTDITISQASPALNALVLTNNYTDTWYYPARQQAGGTGSAISGAYDRLPVCDTLTVSVAESTAMAPVVTVYLYWGE